VAVVALVACARGATPEDIAREYGRGLYANDAKPL
jgi:hypothetical protein